MRRILTFIIVIVINFFIIETVDTQELQNYNPKLQATINAQNLTLSWPKSSSANYYEVEVLSSRPLDNISPASSGQIVAVYRTLNNQLTVSNEFPANTYWRVSAQGLIRSPLVNYSNSIYLTEAMSSANPGALKIMPQATSFYPAESPASHFSFLTWTSVPGAVFYEIEFLNSPPENPNGNAPSINRISFSREVFLNGYQPDFSLFAGNNIYWRVMALDFDGKPLGVYSDAQQIYLDHAKQGLTKPQLTVSFNDETAPPLYPVYSWIPVNRAVKYEVELLSQPPENPYGTESSLYRIWSKEVTGFDCYDDEPRISQGTYYWRVRGLDADGNPVGVYSDAGCFTVAHSKGNYAATFGDSITHGGGAISYSPANPEYSFQTYLKFPVVNLGKSGDTSESLADRFDADVLPFRPRYLIILGGTNSLRGGESASKVIEDLIAIREKCIANGIRPIFLTLPPINPEAIARAFNEDTTPFWRREFDLVNNFVRSQRYYIDLELQMSDANRMLPLYYGIDGLHPDIEGKKMMAQVINANWARVTQ